MFTLAATLLNGCGGPKFDVAETAPIDVPVGVIVEQEISGPVLGRPLTSPFGLAVNAEGSVYCVDRGNDRLIKFRRDLTPVRDAGGAGSAEGLLSRPGFISIDNQLNVFVADEGNQRICRFNSDLLFVDATDFYDVDDPLMFGEPSGVGVNVHGEMWVGDRQRNRIAVFTTAGQFDRFIGEFGSRGGQVNTPEGIRVDAAGRFHVCDAGNGRVIVYDHYGNEVRTLDNSAFAYPMATIPLPNASWLIDGGNGQLFFCDRDGNILFLAGPNLPGNDRPLREPSDIVLLPDNRLLIADTGNNRLLVCRVVSGSE